MAEIHDGKGVKLIPFYLPQFHTIPENDEWWGKGFTEWTNVQKAKPLFKKHDQPKVPLNRDYYDLSDNRVMTRQARLAKSHGIFGFCYYHYWFKNGKKLLEKPAEKMLTNTEIDFPFCFSWANENWSRNWDGGNHEILMKQEYGGRAEWEQHLQYLLPFFRDERYMTVDGKPLFIIYKPEQIIDIYEMVRYWRSRMNEEGFAGICLAFQYPDYYADMYYREDIFDFRIAFEPVFSRDSKVHGNSGTDRRVKILRKLTGEKILSIYRKAKQSKYEYRREKAGHLVHYSYRDAWEMIVNNKWPDDLLPGAFVDWDNTPRNQNGVVYDGFSVELFEKGLTKLIARAKREGKSMLFINAWNEWAEGAFLEPDEKYGFKKLEAVKEAMTSISK